MWQRKACCICRTDFAVHPNAKTISTRQLCLPCRRIKWTSKAWNNAIASGRYLSTRLEAIDEINRIEVNQE